MSFCVLEVFPGEVVNGEESTLPALEARAYYMTCHTSHVVFNDRVFLNIASSQPSYYLYTTHYHHHPAALQHHLAVCLATSTEVLLPS